MRPVPNRGRIPAVFVHGTMSSPGRWADMVNNLVARPPNCDTATPSGSFATTRGQPIAYSALAAARTPSTQGLDARDPSSADPCLRDMIVLGHSQGGLLHEADGHRRRRHVLARPRRASPFEDVEAARRRPGAAAKTSPFVDAAPVRTAYRSFSPRPTAAATWPGPQLVPPPRTAPDHGFRRDRGRSGVADSSASSVGPRPVLQPARPTSIDNMTPGNRFVKALAEVSRSVPGVTAHSIIAGRRRFGPARGRRATAWRQVRERAHRRPSSPSSIVHSSAHSGMQAASPPPSRRCGASSSSTRPHRPVRHRRRRARRAVLRTRSRPDPPRPSHRTRRVASPPRTTPPRAATNAAPPVEACTAPAVPAAAPAARLPSKQRTISLPRCAHAPGCGSQPRIQRSSSAALFAKSSRAAGVVDEPLVARADSLCGRSRVARVDRRDGFGDRVEPRADRACRSRDSPRCRWERSARHLLHRDRTGVDARVGPEHRDARFGRTHHDLPRERVAAASRGRSEGWKHSEAWRRRVDDLGRQDHRDEGEHVQVRAELGVLLDELGDRLPPLRRKRAWRNSGSPRCSASSASGSGRAPAGGVYTPTTS